MSSKQTGGRLLGLMNRSFWLGEESSSINKNRFWLYLLAIGLTLCLVCLIRAAQSV